MVAIAYMLTVLIWGATWIAMKNQLGMVPVEVSILYRFALASTLMLGGLAVTGQLRKIAWRHQPFVLMQALCLFSLNFLCIYAASQYIPSGVVSVVFSAATIFNIAHLFLLERKAPALRTLCGALLGLIGMGALFWQTFAEAGGNPDMAKGLGFALLGTWFFALGSLVSARNSRHGLPLVSVTAWGMAYASVLMAALAGIRGLPFVFDTSPRYVASLLYLAIPGSIVGYTSYLYVVAKLGPERGSYITVMFPIVALMLSAAFEAYQVTLIGAAGLIAVLAGNALILVRRRAAAAPAAKEWRPADEAVGRANIL